MLPPVGNPTAVLFTPVEVEPSEFVTVIVTTLPAVTLLYTDAGTVTVAAVSEDGVTVTFTLIPSAD